MSVVNYWFGMEHKVALYQITGGRVGMGVGRAGTSRDFDWLRWSVCGLPFRDLDSLCYTILLRRVKLISCPLKGRGGSSNCLMNTVLPIKGG